MLRKWQLSILPWISLLFHHSGFLTESKFSSCNVKGVGGQTPHCREGFCDGLGLHCPIARRGAIAAILGSITSSDFMGFILCARSINQTEIRWFILPLLLALIFATMWLVLEVTSLVVQRACSVGGMRLGSRFVGTPKRRQCQKPQTVWHAQR